MVKSIKSVNICIIGIPSVGKTCLLNRLIGGSFDDTYVRTLGVDVHAHTLVVKDKENVKVEIYDCCTTSRTNSLLAHLLQEAKILVLCFDLTDVSSFEALDNVWEMKLSSCPDAKVVLVGIKSDLLDKIVVMEQEVLEKAREYGCAYFAVSSKTGFKVEQLKNHIGELALSTLL